MCFSIFMAIYAHNIVNNALITDLVGIGAPGDEGGLRKLNKLARYL